ncbi:hypothetical protein NDU88_000113 [Pleurodeles waltl]|uniref:Uncharacterized protein n=1 Tax=Pleurodeles waltl TaxID=8319 RepID=A0AAV7S3M1_PLEWA|nr:hypothetical protein NDU88_000113 [Pleurodeles waltl]
MPSVPAWYAVLRQLRRKGGWQNLSSPADQKDFSFSFGLFVHRKFRRTACSAVRKSLHTDADRRNAFGATGTLTHGLARTTLPDFQRGNRRDACRENKNPCTASRNDAQPENKPKNPRTDPGTSGNPANHRKRLTARRKTTHDFPA